MKDIIYLFILYIVQQICLYYVVFYYFLLHKIIMFVFVYV